MSVEQQQAFTCFLGAQDDRVCHDMTETTWTWAAYKYIEEALIVLPVGQGDGSVSVVLRSQHHLFILPQL